MPIRVVATGRVTEAPSRLLGEDVWEVFVLDPFPDIEGQLWSADACEVVCRGQHVAASALESVKRGDRVVVSGELVMERIDGPIEDDLSAVRMWIKATGASRTHSSDYSLAPPRPSTAHDGPGEGLCRVSAEGGLGCRPSRRRSGQHWGNTTSENVPRPPTTANLQKGL